MPKKAALYAGAGSLLIHYRMNLEDCSLERTSELNLDCGVQSGWQHPSKPILYVGASNRRDANFTGDEHLIYALAIDEKTGAVSPIGKPLKLPQRPVYVTCDVPGRHLAVAFPYGDPALGIIRLNEDGSLGELIEKRPDAGIHPHMVRITPDNRFCISVARGRPSDWPHFSWAADKARQKEPGSLEVIEFRDGALGKRTSVTVGDGYQFGSRHLDFHPTGPWVYVQLEATNEVLVFRRDESGVMPEPLQRLCTLENIDDVLLRHMLGTVKVHPRGHALYVANRAHEPIPQRNGTELIYKGANENSFVVYAIDEKTGLLNLIQRIDSGGVSPRDFGLDATGSMLVVANCRGIWVKDGKNLNWQPRNLATFKVFPDGRLELKQKYDEPVAGHEIRWAKVVAY